jgi:hypothetical protein
MMKHFSHQNAAHTQSTSQLFINSSTAHRSKPTTKRRQNLGLLESADAIAPIPAVAPSSVVPTTEF